MPFHIQIEKKLKIEKKFFLIFCPGQVDTPYPFWGHFPRFKMEIWKSPRWRHLYPPKLQNDTKYALIASVVWAVGGGATHFTPSSSYNLFPSVVDDYCTCEKNGHDSKRLKFVTGSLKPGLTRSLITHLCKWFSRKYKTVRKQNLNLRLWSKFIICCIWTETQDRHSPSLCRDNWSLFKHV